MYLTCLSFVKKIKSLSSGCIKNVYLYIFVVVLCSKQPPLPATATMSFPALKFTKALRQVKTIPVRLDVAGEDGFENDVESADQLPKHDESTAHTELTAPDCNEEKKVPISSDVDSVNVRDAATPSLDPSFA